jgi:hypothetical protein
VRLLKLAPMPATRGDCVDGPRPCPHVACRHHLESGWETCSLDVAERGPQSREAIGVVLGLNRFDVRDIEERALERCRENGIRCEHLEALRTGWTHPESDVFATSGDSESGVRLSRGDAGDGALDGVFGTEEAS